MSVRTGFMVLAGLMAALGGCQNRVQQDLAAAENQELRERMATMEQQLRDKDTRIAEKETRITQLQAAPPPAPVVAPVAAGTWQPADTFRASPTPVGLFRSDGGGNVVAIVPGGEIFASGSATIRSAAHNELDRIARDIINNYSGFSIRVEGHTDTTPIRRTAGRWRDNQHLSEARAEAVRDYLIRRGVPAAQISARGLGSSRPKRTHAESRRVEIVVGG